MKKGFGKITIKSWTKAEMIDKVFAAVKWTEVQKEQGKKRALRQSYDAIWDIFSEFRKDEAHALFYANLLVR